MTGWSSSSNATESEFSPKALLSFCRYRGVDHKIADEIIWPAIVQGLTEELDAANDRIAELEAILKKVGDEQNGKCPVIEQKWP